MRRWKRWSDVETGAFAGETSALESPQQDDASDVLVEFMNSSPLHINASPVENEQSSDGTLDVQQCEPRVIPVEGPKLTNATNLESRCWYSLS